MASSRDVKDIMGVAAPTGVAAPSPPAKKPKPVATKRLTGINREVLALHGDRAPPVSIVDSQKTYRAKLKRDFKPAHWDFSPFTNNARRDDLQLRHWKRAKPSRPQEDAMDVDGEDKKDEYSFAKYNVEISVPEYDDGMYEAHLQSSEWSREETDYLIGLVKEYAQKWPVVIDRYQWPPSGSVAADSTAVARQGEERSLEQLKARYYQIWAKTIHLSHGGEAGMNESEFALYETLSKYDPVLEAKRKDLGWGLFKRPLEEIREEEYLLAELQRIMISAQKFEAERAEVRQRLDHPVSKTNGGVPATFAELNTLYNQLFAQDRNRRARGRLSINANDLAQTPGGGTTGNATPASATRRDSISQTQKKASISSAQPIRTLDSRTEAKFGVTTHDRLTSGVTFRSDKLLKMRQAKSQIQTQKITQALIELGIPDILQLPTQRVMDTFEALIQRVQKLVDARKVLEKEEAEARIQGGLRKELQKEEYNADGTVSDPQPPEVVEPDEEEEEEPEEEVKEERSDDEEEEFEGNEDDGEGSAEGSEEADEVENSDQDGEGDGDEMEVD